MGKTCWNFCDGSVAALPTDAAGIGLYANRNFATGEVLLADHWIVGLPLQQSMAKACEQCLRVRAAAAIAA